tara:strand:+ start:152 stop:856 length:705 start_codon:yes stop_codon:yes gene_type:complete
MDNFTLIIPIYNEEKNIFTLYEEIINSEANKYISSIIFIDDASIDDSLKVLNEISKKNQLVKIIKNKQNLGQSRSIYLGILEASTKYVLTIDGDGQNDPKDISKLINFYLNHRSYSLISGIRNNRKDNFIKKITSKIANLIRKFYLNDNCIDTGCALKLFDKEVIISFPFFNGIHRFLPAIYKGLNKNCYFINVNHRYRKFGKSKYGTFLRLFFGIRDMIYVKKLIKNYKKKYV